MKSRSWVILLLAGLLIAVGLSLLAVMGGADGDRAQKPPVVGAAVPDITLTATDGKTYRLSELRGTPLVINFWATWCPPCKQEMPLLEQVSRQYEGRLVVLGVNNGEDQDTIARFSQPAGLTFPLLMDMDGRVAERYFVHNFPATFFVDQDGILRAQQLGLLSEAELARYLKTIGLVEP